MCILIVCAGFYSLGLTLKAGFLWDDHELIVNNSHVQSISIETIRHSFQNDIFNGLGDEYYRPLVTLSFILDYHFWKQAPLGYHVTNLFIHISTAILLFFFLNRLFPASPVPGITALLFVVHPILVEQLLVINGRTEPMAFLFTLATLLAATSKKRSWKISALFFFCLACLSKETGLAFPFFLALTGWFKPELRTHWKWYIGYAAIAIGYLVLRSQAVTNPELLLPIKDWVFFLVRDLPMILTKYLRILIFPFDLHSHRRMDFDWTWLILTYVILGLITAEIFISKSKFLLFCLGWALIGLLPKLPVLMTNALMLDHWVYPSNAGVMLLIAFGISRIRTKWRLSASLVLILFFYSPISWANALGRNTEKKLFHWALTYKSSSIVRTNLGLVYYKEGNLVEAEKWLKEGLTRNPNDSFAINGLALVYWKTNRSLDALAILDAWLKDHPTHEQSLRNRALIQSGTPS